MPPKDRLNLYPTTMAKATDRLSRAANLCGMGGYNTAIGSEETSSALNVALDGGWRHGILPLVTDIAVFLSRSKEFEARYGNSSNAIATFTACLCDAIDRGDVEALDRAIAALKPQ